MKSYLTDLKNIFKKPSTWLFLTVITLAAGIGFYLTVLRGGSSKLSGAVNFILTAMIILIPALTIENRPESTGAPALTARFFAVFTVALLGAFPMLLFPFVISSYGVFKSSLYVCGLISVVCMCAVSTAVNLLIASCFRKKGTAYAVSYIAAAFVLLCEVLYSYLTPSFLTRILYIFTVTKYYGAFSLGVADLHTVLLAAVVPAAVILAVSLKGAERSDVK